MPDIDIDFADRSKILDIIDHVPASRIEDNEIKKHNTGVYCQPIPINPLNGLSSIDYKEAESRGYFKIDFLNVSAYQDVKDENHLNKLLELEPIWELLEDQTVCDQMFHINGYHDLVSKLKPRSIEQLAMFLALLRPGKKHLIPVCEKSGYDAIKDEIWTKTDDSYSFKKAHAIAYAHVIKVQLNLLCEQIS